jgi:Protein of unknown function (DUF3099)
VVKVLGRRLRGHRTRVGTGEGAIVSHPQRQRGPGSPDPVLITDAARSYQDELAARKRRYAIMMSMRVPCMVLAAVFYQIPWLAVGLLVLSIPLPWMAVLIANDRLPIKREKVNRLGGVDDRRALEARAHPVVDADDPVREYDGPIVDGGLLDGHRVRGAHRGG